MVGTELHYLSSEKKVVFLQKLMKEKGTDASNIYDEEMPHQDDSDDESKMKKPKNKSKKRSV